MTKPNPAVQKTLSYLISPACLLSILLLVLNDFVFKIYWPSWLTGKLSDFAWMFFAPVIVFLFASILLPDHTSNHPRGWFIGTSTLLGLAFLFLKTSAPANSLILTTLAQIFRYHFSALIDPTDLIALISLPLSYYFWSRSTPGRRFPTETSWAWMSLLMVLTMADSPAPLPENIGIACLKAEDGVIIGQSLDKVYSSVDGGLTWQVASFPDDEDYLCRQDAKSKLEYYQNDQEYLYRSQSEQVIEESVDFGTTWQVVFNTTAENFFRAIYFEKEWSGELFYQPGPLDMFYDQASGNVLFAMGFEGILIRKPDSTFVWVNVDRYQRINLLDPIMISTILSGRMLSFLLLLILFFCTLSLPLVEMKFLKIVIYLSWLFWLPHIYSWYIPISFTGFLILAYGMLAFSMAMTLIRKSFRHFMWMFGLSSIVPTILVLLNLGLYFGVVYYRVDAINLDPLLQVISLILTAGLFIWFSILGRRYFKANELLTEKEDEVPNNSVE